MAKNKAPKSETPAEVIVVNPNTAAAHDSAVRKAEKAFLNAAESGDATAERAALIEAKSARKAFMTDRLPIACRSFLDLPADADEVAKQAAMKELRSALSGLAQVATPTAPAAPAAE